MNDTTTTRHGDWMQTYTGRQFWPLDPRPEEIEIEDIAHAIANQCRFAGHCRVFYSVAQHSVLVSLLAGEHDRMAMRAALLHDASEAYVVDVPRPLKRFLPNYAEIEDRVMRAIEVRFDLETGILEHPSIKHWDEVMLATEARDIMGGETGGKWSLRAAPDCEKIEPWNPERAENEFLRRFGIVSQR